MEHWRRLVGLCCVGMVILVMATSLVGCRKKIVSVKPSKEASSESIAGTYKNVEDSLNETIVIRSDNTYTIVQEQTYPDSKRKEYAGYFDKVEEADGTWNDPMNKGKTYKIIARTKAHSTELADTRLEDTRRNLSLTYWYYLSDGSLTSGVFRYKPVND
jgi:hypothetical protein